MLACGVVCRIFCRIVGPSILSRFVVRVDTRYAGVHASTIDRPEGGCRLCLACRRCSRAARPSRRGPEDADIDNDGHLDLYVTNLGPNVLYRNRGDGTFGLLEASGAEDPRWSIGASFADFDRDGLVDLYVANYIEFRRDAAKRRGASECTYTAH